MDLLSVLNVIDRIRSGIGNGICSVYISSGSYCSEELQIRVYWDDGSDIACQKIYARECLECAMNQEMFIEEFINWANYQYEKVKNNA